MKKDSQKVLDIINDYKNKSNKDLIFALDFMKEDFDRTKNTVLKLTEHLDKVEITYNLILKEFNSRNNA